MIKTAFDLEKFKEAKAGIIGIDPEELKVFDAGPKKPRKRRVTRDIPASPDPIEALAKEFIEERDKRTKESLQVPTKNEPKSKDNKDWGTW